MEHLKRLADICQPDERNQNRWDIDLTTGAVTPTTIESIYAVVEEIKLNAGVPDEVRSHFEIARNLALYSWFVYSFNVIAGMQAFASLELAVRAKTADRRTVFKQPLDRAFNDRQLSAGVSLATVVTKRRNDLAHGSSTMNGQGLGALRMCADLINLVKPYACNLAGLQGLFFGLMRELWT
jgi:hypothetical protein